MKPLLVLVSILCLAGCSRNAGQKIEGKITFADGSPLGVGAIVLSNGKNSYSAAIESDGSYAIENVFSGDYKVAISGAMVGGYKPKEFEMNYDANGNYIEPPPAKPPIHLVKESMGNPETSGLSVKVPGTYDVKVEKP